MRPVVNDVGHVSRFVLFGLVATGFEGEGGERALLGKWRTGALMRAVRLAMMVR